MPRIADTTDSLGRFSFGALKNDRHYVIRVSKVGYLARLITVDLTKRGREEAATLEARSAQEVGALLESLHGAQRDRLAANMASIRSLRSR